jgi:hypothetical protein
MNESRRSRWSWEKFWGFGMTPLSKSLSEDPTMQLPWLGFRIFKWLLAVATLLLILIVTHAIRSYPSQADVLSVLPPNATMEQRLAAIREVQSQWLASIQGLAQTFVLTPLFPVIGAVVGYIFGVSRQQMQPTDGGTDGGQLPIDPNREQVTTSRQLGATSAGHGNPSESTAS